MSKEAAQQRGLAKMNSMAKDHVNVFDGVNQERDFTPDEIEFMKAMDQYKRDKRHPFPAWHEVLGVLKKLGYRKDAP